jgi:hypothetical protein
MKRVSKVNCIQTRPYLKALFEIETIRVDEYMECANQGTRKAKLVGFQSCAVGVNTLLWASLKVKPSTIFKQSRSART